MARWQSGDAAACKAVNSGSIPLRASRCKMNNSSNKQIEKSWDILETDENSNLLCVKHHRYKILCFMWHPERDMTDFEIISTLLS